MGFLRKDRELFELLGERPQFQEKQKPKPKTSLPPDETSSPQGPPSDGMKSEAPRDGAKRRRRVELPNDARSIFPTPRTGGLGEDLATTIFPEYRDPARESEEPIIVVEDELPPKPASSGGMDDTFEIRRDFAWISVAGFVVLLCTSFMLGRSSVGPGGGGQPDGARLVPIADPAGQKTQNPAAPGMEKKEPARETATEQGRETLERLGTTAEVTDLESLDVQSSGDASTKSKRYTIIVATTNEAGAKDLRDFLKERDYDAYVQQHARYWTVQVGGFESTRSDEARRTLDELKKLEHDGKREFKGAYFSNVR